MNKQKRLERLEKLKMNQAEELECVEFDFDTTGLIVCKNKRCKESWVGECGYCDEHCTNEDCSLNGLANLN